MGSQRISKIRQRLAELDKERRLLLKELHEQAADENQKKRYGTLASDTPLQTSQERIALFTRLFRCRADVFPKLWENPKKGTRGYSPACQLEWVRGVCSKPKVKCSVCPNQSFVPLDEGAIRSHLEGSATIGTYAIREDDTCVFLAADFDKAHWREEVMAYKSAAAETGVEAYVEVSRSGNGAHAWIFFAEPVAAKHARQLGTLVLTRAISQTATLGFDSYDRLFPSQDTLPKGGFGNLIALPLQRLPRKSGTTVFVDDAFTPFRDQWEFLRCARLLSRDDIAEILAKNFRSHFDSTLNAHIDPDIVTAEGTIDLPGQEKAVRYEGQIQVKQYSGLDIDILDLPARLVAELKRAATFANPKFFELQRMRFSTWHTPRYICAAELSEDGSTMRLPRGLLARCMEIIKSTGADAELIDLRPGYRRALVKFTGELQPSQKKALRDILKHDAGVLVAPPGSGKTVIGCAVIARRKLTTLILVHRKQLAEQWKQRLLQFTDLTKKQIGAYDSKGLRRKGVVDIGMLQTLAREKDPGAILGEYGNVIVDECHHVPALSFEPVLKRIVARYHLGLTATPYRKDGLEKIIHQQCGPVVHTMVESSGQIMLGRRAIVRETAFQMGGENTPHPALHEIWEEMVKDEDRLRLIAQDIRAAAHEGEFPLVLSDRKDHLELLLEMISREDIGKTAKGFILTSELGKKKRSQAIDEARLLHEEGEPVLLLSTGSLIGEGFDLPELSCLILAMPLSFKGRLVQYAGRLHREQEGKTRVAIYDYVDAQLGLGITMFRKRLTTYRKMGYMVEMSDELAAKIRR